MLLEKEIMDVREKKRDKVGWLLVYMFSALVQQGGWVNWHKQN